VLRQAARWAAVLAFAVGLALAAALGGHRLDLAAWGADGPPWFGFVLPQLCLWGVLGVAIARAVRIPPDQRPSISRLAVRRLAAGVGQALALASFGALAEAVDAPALRQRLQDIVEVEAGLVLAVTLLHGLTVAVDARRLRRPPDPRPPSLRHVSIVPLAWAVALAAATWGVVACGASDAVLAGLTACLVLASLASAAGALTHHLRPGLAHPAQATYALLLVAATSVWHASRLDLVLRFQEAVATWEAPSAWRTLIEWNAPETQARIAAWPDTVQGMFLQAMRQLNRVEVVDLFEPGLRAAASRVPLEMGLEVGLLAAGTAALLVARRRRRDGAARPSFLLRRLHRGLALAGAPFVLLAGYALATAEFTLAHAWDHARGRCAAQQAIEEEMAALDRLDAPSALRPDDPAFAASFRGHAELERRARQPALETGLLLALCGYLILRLVVRERLARAPILFLRSFSSPEAARVFGRLVARTAGRLGIAELVVHERQPAAEVLRQTGLADRPGTLRLADATWFESVRERLPACACVIIDPGRPPTASVLLELEEALASVPERTIVLRREGDPPPDARAAACIVLAPDTAAARRRTRRELAGALRRVLRAAPIAAGTSEPARAGSPS
jgi:hypothetical protein